MSRRPRDSVDGDDDSTMAHRTLARTTASAAAAFVVYGGWAVFANWRHGEAAALRSGAAQGLVSAALTLVLTLLMEAVFRRVGQRRFGALLTMLICSLVCQGATIAVHVAVGTPELLATLAPSLLVGGCFIVVYVLALRRAARVGA